MTDLNQRIELKYLIDEPLAKNVTQWARDQLGVDPHCVNGLADSYDIHTLYLDTPEYDLFHRTGVAGESKHRIRKYGRERTLWLECKRKKQDVVRKTRTAVHEADAIERLTNPAIETTSPNIRDRDPQLWCGDWFLERMRERRLVPAMQLYYRRFARESNIEGESLRLTIDSQLQATPVNGWNDSLLFGRMSTSAPITVSDQQILELKFHNHMPTLFKDLLRRFAYHPEAFPNTVPRSAPVESLLQMPHPQIRFMDRNLVPLPMIPLAHTTSWPPTGSVAPMPNWTTSVSTELQANVTTLVVRLLLAWLCGWIVSAIARDRRSPENLDTLSLTLVLMSILIAMATQIIGDNVARAFSLVGALSIVRFRTAVPATRDVAFVLAAVVVGMAIGAGQYLMTGIGLCIVFLATHFVHTIRIQDNSSSNPSFDLELYPWRLTMQVGLAGEGTWESELKRLTADYRLVSGETARRGGAMELVYRYQPNAEHNILQIVSVLNALPSVETVAIKQA